MGTTLTGTTPQDTYDSLIKVTDNGPLTGSLKVLTDGLGNNSALSLSTAAASVTGTLAVTTGTNLATSSGSVGIGLSAPTQKLEIQDGASGAAVKVSNSGGGSAQLAVSSNATSVATLSFTNSLAITGGNVGIGTSAPTAGYRLSVVGAFSAALGGAYVEVGDFDRSLMVLNHTNVSVNANLLQVQKSGTGVFTINPAGIVQIASGIQFPATQVASADANTLDDYEEGTWTMGISFGGASVGVTYASNTGTYTKIGRQVTVNGIVILSSKGSSTGDALITGLPFTIPNAGSNLPPATLWLNRVTFLNQHQAVGKLNTTSVEFWDITTLGATAYLTNSDFANNSEIIINMTYFV